MRLIDADVLIEKIKTDKFTHVRNDYSSGYNDGIFHSGVVADNLPTVDAVPVRHGKWTRENNYGIWKCSECGCKVNRVNPLKGNIWNYNYCPNCGARMYE